MLRRAVEWFRENGFDDEMDAFLAGETGIWIEEIDLTSVDEFNLLLRFMENNLSVTQLCLLKYGNHTPELDMARLCSVLANNTVLRVLALSQYEIGTEGACALGQLLKETAHLKELHICASEIQDDGLIGLSEGLQQNSSLRLLRLYSDNSIGSDGFAALANAMKHHTGLQSLDITKLAMHESDFASFIDALKTNRTLEDLIIGSEEIATSFPYIVDLLQHNVSLLTYGDPSFDHPNPQEIERLLLRNKILIPAAARRTALFLIGIRRSTNYEGMGDFNVFPKDIVRLIAQTVWATRKDPIWIQAIPDPGAAGEQH